MCGAILLGLPAAAAPTLLSEMQKSHFMSVAHVVENTYAVPTMVDVHVPMDIYSSDTAAVTDGMGVLLPSTVYTASREHRVHMSATATPEIAMAQNITDGSFETFADLPFVEAPDHASREHHITIDLVAQQPITTDTLRIFTDTYSATPTRVRVVAVRSDGTEHVASSLRPFEHAPIHFPKETATHFRIDVMYTDPLRITEIILQDHNHVRTQDTTVRFIATPGQTHAIYFNPHGTVHLPLQEQPNFSVPYAVPVVPVISVQENPVFGRADTDGDGIVDGEDNCPHIVNADQIDANANGIGDACEDFDADGIINAQDNCPLVANRAQIDTDGDGIGDACDDEESRFFEKQQWIVYAVIFVVSMVVLIIIARVLTSQTLQSPKM